MDKQLSRKDHPALQLYTGAVVYVCIFAEGQI